jgi:hypothetical protein
MQSLSKRLQPLLTGAVSISDLDTHTRKALDIFAHFKAVSMVEGKTPDQIREELESLPESVRGVMREACRKEYVRQTTKNRG